MKYFASPSVIDRQLVDRNHLPESLLLLSVAIEALGLQGVELSVQVIGEPCPDRELHVKLGTHLAQVRETPVLLSHPVSGRLRFEEPAKLTAQGEDEARA